MKHVHVFHRNCIFRDCLATFLRSTFNFDAKGVDHSVDDGTELDWIPSPSTLILLDLNLPDDLAFRIVHYVRESRHDAKIVLLVPDDHERLLECISAGIQGCVLERSSLVDLEMSVSKALAGEIVCSQDFGRTIFLELSRSQSRPWTSAPVPRGRLTNREHEVLRLLARQNSNKQIAKSLSISLHTVKNHVHNILEKLDVDSRVGAVETARKEKWLCHP